MFTISSYNVRGLPKDSLFILDLTLFLCSIKATLSVSKKHGMHYKIDILYTLYIITFVGLELLPLIMMMV